MSVISSVICQGISVKMQRCQCDVKMVLMVSAKFLVLFADKARANS